MSARQRQMHATGGPADAEFLEFLAAQRADYRSGLGEKFARMAALWNLIAHGDGDTADLLELERQAHSVAGSGATFGYRDLGAGARTLELAVHRVLECHASPSDSQRTEIAAAMLAVNECVP
jgi:chemotaxis protein histidine kinase CheA